MKKRWKWGAAGLVAAVILLLALRFAVVHRQSSDFAIAATVNGEPIIVRELRQEMLAKRALIFDYFKRTYGIDDNPTFWTSVYGGEIPLDKLRREAIQESVKIKFQQILAKQKGLVQGISYASFLDHWKQENKNRADAVKHNKVIFGPQQYDEAQYYDVVISNLIYELKQRMTAETPISDNEMQAYYDAHKNEYKRPDTVKAELWAIPYGNGMKKEEAARLAAQLDEKLTQGGMMEKTGSTAAVPSFVKRIEKTFDDQSYPLDSKQYPNVLKAAQVLPVGRISEPIDDNGALYIVKSLQRTDGAYVPFDQAKADIAKMLMDQRFPDLIDQLLKKADVVINRDVVNQLTAETF
jgi:hypothetical protein